MRKAALIIRLIVTGILSISACTTSHSATVTYSFTGQITYNSSNAFTGPGFPGVAEGDVFMGTMVFDDAAVDTEPLATVGRFYLSPPPASLVQMTVNGLTFTSSVTATPIITTNNDIFGRDSFALVEHQYFDLPSGWIVSGQNLIYTSDFAAIDYSQTAFDSDAIPPNLMLSNFQQQNEYCGVRFTIQTTGTSPITLDHPGGTTMYVGSVDMIGELLTLTREGATLAGDFNESGQVDAADYVFWRNNVNTPSEYDLWRANFGNSLGGAVLALNSEISTNVPESTFSLFAGSVIVSSWRAASMRFRRHPAKMARI